MTTLIGARLRALSADDEIEETLAAEPAEKSEKKSKSQQGEQAS